MYSSSCKLHAFLHLLCFQRCRSLSAFVFCLFSGRWPWLSSINFHNAWFARYIFRFVVASFKLQKSIHVWFSLVTVIISPVLCRGNFSFQGSIMFIFSGSRNLHISYRPLVHRIVSSLNAAGHPLAVGCAPGLDSFVRQAPHFNGQVFKATSKHASALVQRSALLVQTAAAAPGKVNALIAFPATHCPSSMLPSPSVGRCFCGKGSGTWATAALAAGLGIPVFVFGVEYSGLPESWAGWEESTQFGTTCFRCPPAPTQLNLFK